MSSSSSSSEQMFEVFFSKVGERITDYTHTLMKNIVDFKLSLESLKKSLKELNAKASEVEGQITFSKGSCQKKRKREVEEWLARVKSIENEVFELGAQAESEGFIRNLMDGGKVAKLNEEVGMLSEQSRQFDELLRDVCDTRGVELLTTRMVGEAFEENCNEILSLLMKREVSSIGIYGMGGVGKTALAKCINNRLLEQSQVLVFWIGVSREFSIKCLQEKIAHYLGISLLGEDDEDIRAARLHRALSQMKNSVLILDDLWGNVDMLKVGCPVSKECCRLIITTRSLEVCVQIGCQKVIGVRPLCDNDAWKLFTETLGQGQATELSPDVKKIAESMSKSCGGLPLGIINVAGNMKGKTSIHAWIAARAELPMTSRGVIGEGEVFEVLKYSFDWLNIQSKELNTLQRCFLYCSLYPQGLLANKEELVESFISEGLMDERESRRAQVHQGYSILEKLTNLCLLETRGHDERLEMHDLVRGMALRINEGKYLVRAGIFFSGEIPREIPDEEEWTKELEKVSLMLNHIRTIRDGVSPNCPKLSTLILDRNPLEVIPDLFFSKMQGLCTLDLRSTHITMLPDCLSDMKSLKALLLEYCHKLEKVPYLGRLKALRELNLAHTAIEEVPQGVEELLNLKFLSLAATKLKVLPAGLLLKLECLRYLRFPVEVQAPMDEILNLEEMEQFWGRLNDVSASHRFMFSELRHAFYHVHVGQYHDDGVEMFGFHDRELYLSECNLKDEKLLVCTVESLTISKCDGLGPCLSHDLTPYPDYHPQSLKRLIIKQCGGIECILTCTRASRSLCSTLESIHLEALEDFEGLTEVGLQSVFSTLRQLTIEKCNKMRKLGLPASRFPNLEQLEIAECGEIEAVFKDEARGYVTLPKFNSLSLSGLPKLKRVSKATMICRSLRSMSILQCPELVKKLPLHSRFEAVPSPPLEREIRVEREWWESLEWENPSLPQLLQPFVRFQGK